MKTLIVIIWAALSLTACFGEDAAKSKTSSDITNTTGSDTTGSDSMGSDSMGSDTTGSNPPSSATITYIQPLSKTDDTLLSTQWGLRNTGQTVYARFGGTPGEDMNGWSGSTAFPSNYAGGMTGYGVKLAIVDTGLEITHEDLSANVVPNGSYNFVDSTHRHDPTNRYQAEDHGTSAAGLAAARGGNGKGIWGVAPAASLYGFNLLQSTSLNAELAALGDTKALSAYPGLNSAQVDVFNRSYGTNPYQEIPPSDFETSMLPVMEAIQKGTESLRDGKGALYVKAAGNEFDGGNVFSKSWCQQASDYGVTCYNVDMEPENNSPYEILVGAFNAEGKRASYSNTGAALWISAAGGEFGYNAPAMMTTDMTGCTKGYSRSRNANPNNAFNRGEVTENQNCQYFSAFNGTSAATPMAAGAVALILQAYPNASWRDVKAILAKTARKIDPNYQAPTMLLKGQKVVLDSGWTTNAAGYHFNNAFGFGAVDILSAVDLAKQWQQTQYHLPALQTVPAQQKTVNQTVPDSDPIGLRSQMQVSQSLTAETVTVHVSIQALENVMANDGIIRPAMDNSDYQIELISPSGTHSILLTPFSAYQSGHAMGDLMLSSNAFYGESITGNWTLVVRDLDGSTYNRLNHKGEGKLTKWSIEFMGH